MPPQLVGVEELCGSDVRMHGRDLARFQSLAKATADALVHGASAAPLFDNKSKGSDKHNGDASGDFYCADGPGAWVPSAAAASSSSSDLSSGNEGNLSSPMLVSSRCGALASQWCLEAADLWRHSPHSFRAQVRVGTNIACLCYVDTRFRVGRVPMR